MAPKFRGSGEDWLDQEQATKRERFKNKKQGTGLGKKENRPLAQAETNATVSAVFQSQCQILMDDGQRLLCSYRRAQIIRRTEERERAPVAVGDRVLGTVISPTDAVIEGVAQRRNRLARPVPSRGESFVHVLVANIDILVVVVATREPEFSPSLVDRFLIAAQAEKITPIICVNKIDLAREGVNNEPEPEKPWRFFVDLGIELFEISAKFGIATDALLARLKGKTVAFCGHSGVGKTALLRRLSGTEIGQVGAVNAVTGKGKHTTTGAVLIDGPSNSRWIDTPGIKEFGLLGVGPGNLVEFFPEFSTLACTKRGCLHRDEPGCAAAELNRYSSYRRILESLFL